MIKSPLRYPGGKSRAIKMLAPLIPDFIEYREPFVGGGSLFVYFKQIFSQREYWVNDLYYDLANFWQVCQQELTMLITQIELFREQFDTGKEMHRFLLAHKDEFNPIELAAAFFIFNRITFSGTTLSGGFSQKAFEGRFTMSSIERLKPFSQLLTGIRITNLDYEKLIQQPGKNVFIFCDPPYYSATKSALYGKNGNLHKSFDHVRFAQTMKNCSHKWMITYDDCPYIRKLFSYANIVTWNIKYGMRNVTSNSTQNEQELIITNYDLKVDNLFG